MRFVLVLLLAWGPVVVRAADAPYTVRTQATPIPATVPAALRGGLTNSAVVCQPTATAPSITFWRRAAVPAPVTAEQLRNGITYREVPTGTLLGVVQLGQAWTDYRNQRVPAGVYSLRLVIQPTSDDHHDTAPHTDFVVLTPIQAETTLERLEWEAIVKASAPEGKHARVALLYPHHRPGAEAKLHMPAEGVWTLQTAWHIVGDGGATGQLGGALTLIGSSPALRK